MPPRPIRTGSGSSSCMSGAPQAFGHAPGPVTTGRGGPLRLTTLAPDGMPDHDRNATQGDKNATHGSLNRGVDYPDGVRMSGKRTPFAERRRAVGLTQESLADRLGVDRRTVQRWERGDNEPDLYMRSRLAGFLRVSLDELNRLLAITPMLLQASTSGANPDQSARIEYGVMNPLRIDDRTVAALADVLSAQRRLDDALGSAALIAPTMAQLRKDRAAPQRISDIGLSNSAFEFCNCGMVQIRRVAPCVTAHG